MREAIRASEAEATTAARAARARSHARASASSDDLERARRDAHRLREEAILAEQRAEFASLAADHSRRQYEHVAWEMAANEWAEARRRIPRRGRSRDAARHPKSSTRASSDGSWTEDDHELARALRASVLEDEARRGGPEPVISRHPFSGHPSTGHSFAGHPAWAPSDGTPNDPTTPTTPSAPPASRFDDDEAAQIAEAIRLSQEEANLAEALRRSAIESRSPPSPGSRSPDHRSAPNHRSAPLRPGSARASSADIRVELDEGARLGSSAYRDIARAAFRRTVFGADERERASESKPPPPPPRRPTDENLAPPPRTRRPIIDDAREAFLAEERRARLEVEEAARRSEEAARLEREREEARVREREEARVREREEARVRERERRMERKRRSEAAEAARRSEEAAERVERESAARRAASDVGAMDLPDALRAVGFAPTDATDPVAVRKAYKRAALRFHPDRTRSASLADRVAGEEVWKLLGSKMEAYAAATRDGR